MPLQYCEPWEALDQKAPHPNTYNELSNLKAKCIFCLKTAELKYFQ